MFRAFKLRFNDSHNVYEGGITWTHRIAVLAG
jgi:hypothetical protein